MQPYSYIKTAFYALFSLMLVISIITFPKQAFEASLRGLTIWWDVVFPALLPFFITSELLMGFGVVHFLGVLLEPFMKPLFRVPGTGAFVMSMGLASGYPMGAKLTVRLREQGLITRSEGERLVSITSTSGPLFMFGAVAVGFFHDVRLGVVIALAHYIAAFFVGLVMRFHDYHGAVTSRLHRNNSNIFLRALQAMHHARIDDKRTIGTLMGDAVMSSVHTLLMIGGFIIMFSVMLNIMNIIGLQYILTYIISFLFLFFGITTELSSPLIAGIFEITLGAQLASEVRDTVPLVSRVAVASAVIAWSGLSVHAQVASMLAKTDIRYKPYLFARIMHAVLAAICTILLWNPLQRFLFNDDSSVMKLLHIQDWNNVWDRYIYFSYTLLLLMFLLSLLYFLIQWAKRRTGN